MRVMIISASVLLACAPAAAIAQDVPADAQGEVVLQDVVPDAADETDSGTGADTGMSELADKLSDPFEQQKMAAMVGAVGEVLMQVPVGPLVEAVSRAVPEDTGADMPEVAPDATLRDLAGASGARQMQVEIAEKVPVMMGLLAGLVKGAETMRPALKDIGRQLQQQLSALKPQ